MYRIISYKYKIHSSPWYFAQFVFVNLSKFCCSHNMVHTTSGPLVIVDIFSVGYQEKEQTEGIKNNSPFVFRDLIYKAIYRCHYITLHYITSHHITSHHITSHHITSHHITSHHITSHHNTLHHITLHYITLHYITLHYITLHHITSHYIASHRIASHHIASHHITSHHITLHHRFSQMSVQRTNPMQTFKLILSWNENQCLISSDKCFLPDSFLSLLDCPSSTLSIWRTDSIVVSWLTWTFLPDFRVVNVGTRAAVHIDCDWDMRMIDSCFLKRCV